MELPHRGARRFAAGLARATIVLLGPRTHSRKHVDWEIAACLREREGTGDRDRIRGLFGVQLPGFPSGPQGEPRYGLMPPRLVDNVKSGHAALYPWDHIVDPEDEYSNLREALREAVERSEKHPERIDNSRPEFVRNRPVRKVEFATAAAGGFGC